MATYWSEHHSAERLNFGERTDRQQWRLPVGKLVRPLERFVVQVGRKKICFVDGTLALKSQADRVLGDRRTLAIDRTGLQFGQEGIERR